MKRKLRAVGYTVVLEKIECEPNIENGDIVIPDSVDDETRLEMFVVRSLGFIACNDDYEIGDVVIVDKYEGTEVVCDEVTYRIVDDDKILAKID